MEKMKIRWLAEIIGYTKETEPKMIIKTSTKNLQMVLSFFAAIAFSWYEMHYLHSLNPDDAAKVSLAFPIVVISSLLLYSASMKAYAVLAKSGKSPGKDVI